MKSINDEYLQFIEKIMSDKKELTRKCDYLIAENAALVQAASNSSKAALHSTSSNILTHKHNS